MEGGAGQTKPTRSMVRSQIPVISGAKSATSMASATNFKVQLQDGDSSAPRTVRRILLCAEALKSHKILAGDLVLVGKDLALKESFQLKGFAIGIAWPSLELPLGYIGIHQSHAMTAKLSDGDQVVMVSLVAARLLRSSLPSLADLPEASIVQLQEIAQAGKPGRIIKDRDPIQQSKRRDWIVLAAREVLVELRYVTSFQVIEIIYEGDARRFQVDLAKPRSSLTSSSSDLETEMEALTLGIDQPKKTPFWLVTWDTTVTMVEHDHRKLKANPQHIPSLETPYANVGGLDKQIQEVKDLIEIPLTRPHLFRHFGLKPPRGILLHGPPGTGKTHLASSIAGSSNASLLTISGPELSSAFHGETELKLRNVFNEAKQQSPCVIVIDEVDALCPKREESGGGVESRVVATLLTLMDRMGNLAEDGEGQDGFERVVVVATTNRPNAIDSALRRPGRFDREIEIGIPDVPGRMSILQVLLSKTPHEVTLDQLQHIAKATHGYVGADLAAVVREAGTRAIKRELSLENQSSSVRPHTSTLVTYEDLLHGTTQIHPSALREHFMETPSVKWADIGGQAMVKQKLKECVEWPLSHPEAFRRLGVVAPKGVLLYGPPGCSKTLTAKALATESGINFIAVKGPELLNKYVGESERAVRDIFRKARAAAPAIIFFDEIDALASSRAGGEGNSHEGVLTSLLNEMDGIQELVGVTIVAATNRPDVIDSALLRPGRLDRILYVGPPDYDTRFEILKIKTSKMSVDPSLDLAELATLTEGCSGAEIASICQVAALAIMQRDITAPYVPQQDFIEAAKTTRRQITKEMVRQFEEWRDQSGIGSA